MALDLSILYRGPLASCNYGCEYCPFAKRAETVAQLAADRQALERFISWVSDRHHDQISVLFTPWGEALIHHWYQSALAQLTHLPQVVRVAIQTNLSCRLEWVENCDQQKLALWTTYHPSEVDRARFVSQCWDLERRGVRFSVGLVGLKEHRAAAQALRKELPSHVYLWINAYKREPNYYTSEELEYFTAIDPLFPINNQHHPSLGKSCRTGHSVITVDGEGAIRRCHFIPQLIGNIYKPGFEEFLATAPCTNQTCRCHIGYVHLHELGLYEIFGSGVLERIPEKLVWL